MRENGEPEKSVESESESGEEEWESGEEEEEEEEAPPAQAVQQVSKKAPSSAEVTAKKFQSQSAAKPAASSSEEEDDTGSESEDIEKSNTGARKPRSKPPPVTPTKSTATKRPVDEKAKKKPEASAKKSNDDSKKLLFQRLWSEEDEIAILKGMLEYASKKKSDPLADLTDFHDFIKKNLHVDVTRTQLQDKIRRLRKKYENNKNKENGGKARTFTNPHEQKAYALSKSIWGGNEAAKENGEKVLDSPKVDSGVKKAANTRDSKGMVGVGGDGEKLGVGKRVSSSGLSTEGMIMAVGQELFEGGKGVEGERQWKKLRIEGIEAHLRQLEVKTAQTRLVLDVLKSTEH